MSFDLLQDRFNTDSEKWNTYPQSVIPMSIADSDYATPKEIITAITKRLHHPVLGYGIEPCELRTLIVERIKRLYEWDIQPEWITFIPSVVNSLNISRGIVSANSGVVTSIPSYPHLCKSPPLLNCQTQFFNMLNINGRYVPNFEELETVINRQSKLLILCNPYNPTGTVYNYDELSNFSRIAEKYDLIICSDDIHSDFALYDSRPYRPIASLSPTVSQRTITLMSPSKTFNIAGLGISFSIIEDDTLRNKFKEDVKGLVGSVNILGFVAAEAAYRYCDNWLTQQIAHLRKNAEYCFERINSIPYVSMNKIEGTSLAWVDANQLRVRIDNESLHDYFIRHGLAVTDGKVFGNENFFRLNLATTYDTVEKGLNIIERSVKLI